MTNEEMNALATAYMARNGMREPFSDHAQNFMLSHLVTFALEQYAAANEHFEDEIRRLRSELEEIGALWGIPYPVSYSDLTTRVTTTTTDTPIGSPRRPT